MEFLKQHATSIIVVLVIAIGFAVYSVFFKKEALPDGVVAETIEGTPGDDLIAVLHQLKAINLDGAIFSENSFKGLIDFSLDLEPEDKGRANPFAPIGR